MKLARRRNALKFRKNAEKTEKIVLGGGFEPRQVKTEIRDLSEGRRNGATSERGFVISTPQAFE